MKILKPIYQKDDEDSNSRGSSLTSMFKQLLGSVMHGSDDQENDENKQDDKSPLKVEELLAKAFNEHPKKAVARMFKVDEKDEAKIAEILRELDKLDNSKIFAGDYDDESSVEEKLVEAYEEYKKQQDKEEKEEKLEHEHHVAIENAAMLEEEQQDKDRADNQGDENLIKRQFADVKEKLSSIMNKPRPGSSTSSKDDDLERLQKEQEEKLDSSSNPNNPRNK